MNTNLNLSALGLACLTASVVAQTFQPLYSFNQASGPTYPYAGLTLGADGRLYGTTHSGNNSENGNTAGSVFQMTASGTLTMMISLASPNAIGANPGGGLVLGSDGSLYGTTSKGGAGGNGTVFGLKTDGDFTTVANFTLGSYSHAALVLGADGNLYGTTKFGGSADLGTVFQVSPAGMLTTLASFTGSNGANPISSPVLGPDGNLYGTTSRGGNAGTGAVFKLATNGTLTALFSFGPTFSSAMVNENGAFPRAGLILGPDGNFYGTASRGGHTGNGTIFKVTTNGTLVRLVSFAGTDGASPKSRLTFGLDGSLYGTTEYGGTNGGYGTAFKMTTSGALTPLASFGYSAANPGAALALGPGGHFYGTTRYGGVSDWGTVFQVTTNGMLTILAGFSGTNGWHPEAELALGTDGYFYGTTEYGGSNNSGTIFRVATNGDLTAVVNFPGPAVSGVGPWADLTLREDGCLYGTTESGGSTGAGTVFKVTTNGTLITVASFEGNAMGGSPMGKLAVGPDGYFYGTTRNGGPYGGVAFKVNTNGTLTVLARFGDTYTNGAFPEAGLTLGPDGNFYGTASGGGDFWGNGTVFRMTTNGDLRALVLFDGSNGADPQASLTLGPEGDLYGTTHFGGIGGGTVFKVTTNGALSTLVIFGGTNGANPKAPLFIGPDGDFYGTTYFGGSYGYGTAFRMTTNGSLITLVNFAGTNGANPLAGLTLGPDGSLYGTTQNGGAGGGGVVYRLAISPTIVKQPASKVSCIGSTFCVDVSATGTTPLVYQWYFDGSRLLGATGDQVCFSPALTNSTGSYHVVVTNSYGSVTSHLATVTVLQRPNQYGISKSADGTVTLALASIPGSTNRLWTTTNCSLPMEQWQVVATLIAPNALFQFKDTNVGSPTKFYRLSTP